MKSKSLVALVSLLIFTLPISVGASSLNKAEDGVPEQNMDNYINQLETYVKIDNDGTISLDSSYKEDLEIPKKVTEGIEDWMNYLNQLVRDGKADINEDLEVSVDQDVQGLNTSNGDISLFASGRSGVDVHWWGYNIFLNSTETRTVYQSFKTSGGAMDGAAVISRFIPVPPTQLVSAISGAIGGGLVGFGNMIQDENQGNGVRIRFTGLGYAAVPTGVFPQ
ncbi:hypothetical protein GCM10028778_20840 [Barrientosiimonas marina]|uniref:Uncharacterized protein n=1 Tax=Lentibacillus kimchii TaxID=1542911 RepID=A0ABW2UWG5_9BACI